MNKVFVTRQIPDIGLELLAGECQLDVWPGELPPSRAELIEHIQPADGLLCLLSDRIDEEILQHAPSLKVISNYAVGFDNIDVAAATRRGIPVGNTPGVLTHATADFAFALLMAAARRIPEADRSVRAGKWKTWGPKTLLGADLYQATLGLIGFGRIGQAVAQRARGFDMRVLIYDPSINPSDLPAGVQPVALDVLLSQSDFISLHVPLTPQTHHLIDTRALEQMKPTAVLVNTARGAVVDTEALVHALKSGQIASAALDVTDPEPIPADHPLLGLDNLVIAPHIASASTATRDKMAVMAAENLLAGLIQKPLPNCVNPQVYKASH
ncbi:MAG: D-glycerate dehydrogenase [Chloroflexi bacterium]|nr:D-glycerate dehydrogenase [Chloroflexota bacterium]